MIKIVGGIVVICSLHFKENSWVLFGFSLITI